MIRCCCLSNIEVMLICILLQSDWLRSIDPLGQPIYRWDATFDIANLNKTRTCSRAISRESNLKKSAWFFHCLKYFIITYWCVMRRMMKAAIVEKGEGLHCNLLSCCEEYKQKKVSNLTIKHPAWKGYVSNFLSGILRFLSVETVMRFHSLKSSISRIQN